MSDQHEETKYLVQDITAVAGKFKSKLELQKYTEGLYVALKDSLIRQQALEKEVEELKAQLKISPIRDNQVAIITPPNEQLIAEMQIERLKKISMDRQLTLDETKQYDILTKNLYLAKGKPKHSIPVKGHRIEDVSEAELIEMVKDADE